MKTRLEAFDWRIPDVSGKALQCFYADVLFYLGICRILQNTVTLWCSFLPEKIIPATHEARVNINPQTFKQVLKNLPENWHNLVPEMEDFKNPLEEKLLKLQSHTAKFSQYVCITDMIGALQKNYSEFLPKTKMEECHIISLLQALTLKLSYKPSLLNRLDILIQGAKTGWLLPNNIERSLSSIIADCHTQKDPLALLQKIKSIINDNLKQIPPSRPQKSDFRQINTVETLKRMETIISHEAEQLLNDSGNQAIEIMWNKGPDEFVDTFVPLIKNRIIQKPGKKDFEPVITIISNTFKIKKERGEGFLSSSSIRSYLKKAVSES
ncbi:MAG: hypothetical protein ACOCV9_08100 [Marinilabiliaceae bacterium]